MSLVPVTDLAGGHCSSEQILRVTSHVERAMSRYCWSVEHSGADPISAQVAELGAHLLGESEVLAAAMTGRIRDAVPLYMSAAVPVETLRAASLANVAYIFGTIGRTPQATSPQTRADGQARARAGMPLAAVMAAYRVGARYLWERLADAATEAGASAEVITRAAADMWLILDTYTQDMADGYHAHVTAQAIEDQQQQSALVHAILDGHLDGTGLWEAADILRLPSPGSYLVVVAAVAEPGRTALPGIHHRLEAVGLGSAWAVGHDTQIGIVATPAGSIDIDDVVTVLGGPGHGRVGISNAYHDLTGSSHALRLARIALRASTDKRTVTAFGQHPLAAVAAAAPEAAADLAAITLAGLDHVPAADRALLLDTFAAWFNNHGSAAQAAAQLHVHPNTVRYRLRRLEQLTGHALSDPRRVAELSLAIHT
jgi:hypothetical protein